MVVLGLLCSENLGFKDLSVSPPKRVYIFCESVLITNRMKSVCNPIIYKSIDIV